MALSSNTRLWAGRTAQELNLRTPEQLVSENLQVFRTWGAPEFRAEEGLDVYVQAFCLKSTLQSPMVSISYYLESDKAAEARELLFLSVTPDTLLVTNKAVVAAQDLIPGTILKSSYCSGPSGPIPGSAKVIVSSVEADRVGGSAYTLVFSEPPPTTWIDLEYTVVQL